MSTTQQHDRPAPDTVQCGAPQFADDLPEPSFDDLQPFFDEQNRRLAAILARPEARPTAINHSAGGTLRRRMLRAWTALALFAIAASVYWGFRLWRYNYDIYFCVINFAIEALFILISIYSVYNAVILILLNPATASLDRTLRYTRRLGMRPLYLSRGKTYRSSTGFKAGRRLPQQKPVGFRFPVFNLQRTVTVGFAVILTLIMVSCATTIGDGFTMTQNHDSRTEALNSLANMLANL